MQLSTLLSVLLTVAISVPVVAAPIPNDLALRQDDSTSSDTNPLAGLLNGGQQSDSDGEGNAVSTSECGLTACTSGAASSAETGNSTSSSSSTSATDYNISIGKLLRLV